MVFADALQTVKRELGHLDYVEKMITAIDESKRGLARPDQEAFEINAGE